MSWVSAFTVSRNNDSHGYKLELGHVDLHEKLTLLLPDETIEILLIRFD